MDVRGLSVGVTAIAAGWNHSCALTGGGAKCWGGNVNGQLGNGVASYFTTAQAVLVAACSDFTDVAPNGAFCPNVEWLKNRAVTTGCTSTTAYCPTIGVNRLAMAAFMNRLGTALAPAAVQQQAASGVLDPSTAPVVCATADWTATNFPRRVYLDAVFTATAPGDIGLMVELVASGDGGVTWDSVTAQSQRGFVRANRWGNLHPLGHLDVPVGQTVRFGVRVSRGGLPGAAPISDSNCNLRMRVDNRNGTGTPF